MATQGISFFVALKDQMSKPLTFIKDSYKKLHTEVKKVHNEYMVATKPMRKAINDLSRNIQQHEQNLVKVTGINIDKVEKLHQSLGDLFSQASRVQELSISLAKQMGNSIATMDNLYDSITNVSSELAVSFEDVVQSLDGIRAGRVGAQKELEALAKATIYLSETTDLDKKSAAKAFETYKFWYQGSEKGFLNVANAIRFVTAQSNLSANQAAGALESFENAARNLGKQYRTQAAEQAIAVTNAVAATGAEVGDLGRIFETLTEEYTEQGIKMRAVFASFTDSSLAEINKLAKEGKFTELATKMQESFSAMSDDQFKLMQGQFEQLFGVSFRFAQSLREADPKKFGEDMSKALKAMKEVQPIQEDFDKFRATWSGLADQIKNSFNTILAQFQRPAMKFATTILGLIRDGLVYINQELHDLFLWINQNIMPTISSAYDSVKDFFDYLLKTFPEIKTFGIFLGKIFAGFFAFKAAGMGLAILKTAVIGLLAVVKPLLALFAPFLFKAALIYGAWLLLKKGIAAVFGMKEDAVTFTFVLEKVGKVLGMVFEGWKRIFEYLEYGYTNAVKWSTDFFVGVFKAWDGLKNFASNVADGFMIVVNTVKEGVLAVIDTLWTPFKKIGEFISWLRGESLEIKDAAFEGATHAETGVGHLRKKGIIPSDGRLQADELLKSTVTTKPLEGYAEGAIVHTPTVAAIAEDEPEVVIPVSRFMGLANAVASPLTVPNLVGVTKSQAKPEPRISTSNLEMIMSAMLQEIRALRKDQAQQKTQTNVDPMLLGWSI